jgi:transcriptional regulator with XRE-family HTH domain
VVAKTEHALRPAEIVARRVKETREARGWTQAELARRLEDIGVAGASRPTVSKLEGGRYRGVSVDDLIAYAGALGVSPTDLLAPSEDMAPVAVAPRLRFPAVLVRRWIRDPLAQVAMPMLPNIDFTQIAKSDLVVRLEELLEREASMKWSPLTRALAPNAIHEAAVRWADQLRNPPNPRTKDSDGNDR